MRAVISVGMSVASPPARASRFSTVSHITPTGLTVRGEWVETPATTRNDGVILYVHGSGYVVCSSRTHRGITSHLSAMTGLPVFSIDYRLAPTHRYPAAQQDVRAAWDWLVAAGHHPARIVVAGDSAGGHLAITLGLELARTGEPLPGAIVTLSPLIDLAVVDGTIRDRVEHDPFAAPRAAQKALAAYVAPEARTDEGLRIEFDDLDSFPPTLVHCGSREMLAADCTELARRLGNAGFQVEHRVWPGQMHVFQALTAVVPESLTALATVAEFISAHVPLAEQHTPIASSA